MKKDGRWFFDTEAGKEEILSRRIGKNELSTLQAVRAYVEAQREYASRDRDGDKVLEYAQRIGSSPGTKDGLYWPPDWRGNQPARPVGGRGAGRGICMQAKGKDARASHSTAITSRSSPGRASMLPAASMTMSSTGNMIGGFALVAWPAEYGESGIMTFIVNQQGRVYQKDLGPKTAKLALDDKGLRS